MNPFLYYRTVLTGKTRGRPVWYSKRLIMQVETRIERRASLSGGLTNEWRPHSTYWRDATWQDQLKLNHP